MPTGENEVTFIFLSITIAFLLFAVAAIAFVLLYQNKKLKHEQELRTKEEDNQLKVLSAVLQGQENEQRRLAGELHDGLAVEIASVNSFVHHLKPHLIPSETSRSNFERISEMLDELYSNTRKISHGLLPANIEKRGLTSALNDFIQQLNASGGILVKFSVEADNFRISVEKELLVYRIVQELIQNARKHSTATEIVVKIDTSGKLNKIEVTDNGIGFEVDKEAKNYGIGLKSIEARVKLLNGDFILESGFNKGTKACILF